MTPPIPDFGCGNRVLRSTLPAVGRLDPEDTTHDRWIALCHMVDPVVGYRRHVLLAAFDSAEALEEWMLRERGMFEARKAEGVVDDRDWLSGRFLPRGSHYPCPQPRRRRR
jgi:hypothetical protein